MKYIQNNSLWTRCPTSLKRRIAAPEPVQFKSFPKIITLISHIKDTLKSESRSNNNLNNTSCKMLSQQEKPAYSQVAKGLKWCSNCNNQFNISDRMYRNKALPFYRQDKRSSVWLLIRLRTIYIKVWLVRSRMLMGKVEIKGSSKKWRELWLRWIPISIFNRI